MYTHTSDGRRQAANICVRRRRPRAASTIGRGVGRVEMHAACSALAQSVCSDGWIDGWMGGWMAVCIAPRTVNPEELYPKTPAPVCGMRCAARSEP
eukprot:364553-Chlamydomonas_euryale.AAC.1